MDKLFTVEAALKLENHFISASKSLKCAWRNMGEFPQFEKTRKEVADAALDADQAARQMRQYITDNT